MKPMSFVREECANHLPDGQCLGANFGPNLQPMPNTPRPRCLVAGRKRCAYFETCLAPMAQIATDPRRAKDLQEAAAEYLQITNQKAEGGRECPDCGCLLQPRKRLCPSCAKKRKKLANRQRAA